MLLRQSKRASSESVRFQADIVGNKVRPLGGLEVIVSDHCNITCRQCNHASPVIPKWNADVSSIVSDCTILAGVFAPSFIKFIGGEPLLNPELSNIIRGVRRTKLANHHILVTNGLLLDRMDEGIWEQIDEIEISQYPNTKLTTADVEKYEAKANAHGVKFTHNVYEHFRRTFTSMKSESDELTAKVFRACKIAHVWGCHALYQGRLYRCPQSIYVPKLIDEDLGEGIAISERDSLRTEILDLINSEMPLASCSHCVGTSGVKEQHKLLRRTEWRSDLESRYEINIDQALLEENLQLHKGLDDCKVPSHRVHRSPFKKLIETLGYMPKRIRKSTFKRSNRH